MPISECCRFGWYPKTVTFFTAAALALSASSALDCNFMTIILGFTPKNYSRDEFGIGLWSYQGPDGECVSYPAAQDSGVFTDDDNYSEWFINDDLSWTISRIFAMGGFVFGMIALIAACINVIKKEPRLLDFLTYAMIVAFLSEGAKLGLFFGILPCTASNFWYDYQNNEFTNAEQCGLSRGTFISIGSVTAYFISIVLAAGFIARPKHNGEDYNYDETSLPSWMQSRDDPSHSVNGKRSVVSERSVRRFSEPSLAPYENVNRARGSPYDGLSTSRSGFEENITSNNRLNTARGKFLSKYQNFSAGSRRELSSRRMDDMSAVTWEP